MLSVQIQIRLPSFGLSRTTPHATSQGSTRFHTHVINGTVTVETLAFLDEGSSLTLVEAALEEQLGLKGDPDPLELHWTPMSKEMKLLRVASVGRFCQKGVSGHSHYQKAKSPTTKKTTNI